MNKRCERCYLMIDIHDAVILKLRRLYGYEPVSNFSKGRFYNSIRLLYENVRRLYWYDAVIFGLRRLYGQFLKTLH